MNTFRLIISVIIFSLSLLISYIHVNYFNNDITFKVNYSFLDNRFRDEINKTVTHYLPANFYVNFRKTNEIYYYSKNDNLSLENFKTFTKRILINSMNDVHAYYDNYYKTIDKYLIDNSSKEIFHPFTVSILSANYFDFYLKAVTLKKYKQSEKDIINKIFYSESLSTKPIIIYFCYMIISLFCIFLLVIDKIYIKFFKKIIHKKN